MTSFCSGYMESLIIVLPALISSSKLSNDFTDILKKLKNFLSCFLKEGYRVVNMAWISLSCRAGRTQCCLCLCLRRFERRCGNQTHATSSTSILILYNIPAKQTYKQKCVKRRDYAVVQNASCERCQRESR